MKATLIEIGQLTRFTGRYFHELLKPGFEWAEWARQCYFMGNRSLPLVAITSFIMGLVITIQSRPTLVEFGAEAWLPGMVSVSLLREIVPVITALICAGKIGSGIGAELGSMRVTEQIDAMEVSGTNPYKYLVVTRVTASTLMIPVLAIIADAVSLYGAYLGANLRGVLSWTLFWHQVLESLAFGDIIPSITKTIFFGFAIGMIGCYMGYHSSKGTEGVGRSSNSAVVIASLLVFVIDLLAVQITDLMNLN
ncbi:MAG: ABC transporter permease [Bacteroidia bacterium]|jgi:phospholipid/cholesterol/gamma-HCH transport system permease protein|nr:ABC transporter permease [Bacteroidia bacterium]MCC6769459.1 ABC transporter permease [Bacteroidia bacterium]